ncbi:hypothetical protein CA85_48830 [Allorhodopirellula solitaria]|uniref:Uncharacterized protein n=1 Tax=Allorhodopirellula solitaria TaxID=2527987 RepID=A0A5C5WY75_9BACT|nr:hypothetical protein CA85_48830 [Allorhodopirellula solitaria]
MATHRLRSRRPVSARSLRCGLRSSSLRLPSARSLRPGGSGVGIAALAFRARPAGRHPATGLSHAATSLSPSFSDLSRVAASCRRLRRHPAVAGRFAPVRGRPAWRASGPIVATTSCRRRGRFATREERKRSARRRCGSDGLQVRPDGKSFGRRFQLEHQPRFCHGG